jgi:hypothetical protein
LEDRDLGGWIILKPILERKDAMVWNGLICLRTETGSEGALVNTIVNHLAP